MGIQYIQCPKCQFSDNIDITKIPEKGGNSTCPKCGHKFFIKRLQNQTPSPITSERQEKVSAPKTAPSPHAAETKPVAPSIFNLLFHGDGGTLFGIKLVNILLTIVTLGIYHTWGKVRVLKYLYGQTELMGDRFAYHGTGKELFIGRLKVIGIIVLLIAVFIGLNFIDPLLSQLVSFVLQIVFVFVLIPFAMVSARRYRLSRSSWYGIRFSFRGLLKPFINLYGVGAIVSAVTLGIYYPIFRTNLRSFYLNNTYFGNTPFKYNGNGRDLLGSHILAIFLCIVTLGIYLFWYKAKLEQYDWEHTTFSGIRFKSTVTGGKLFTFTLFNLLLILFTIGFALSWVTVRNMRFKFANLILEGIIELDKIKQDARSAKATGEGLADFMNLDSGLI